LLKEVRPRDGHLLQGKLNLIKARSRNGTLSGQDGRPFRPDKELEVRARQIAHKDKIDRDVIGFSTMLSGQA
jgi:hypothetical protein